MSCGEANYRVELATLWVSAILWGFYAALFGAALYSLLNRNQNRLLLSTVVILFVLTTATMTIGLVSLLETPTLTCNTECVGQACYTCSAETPQALREAQLFSRFTVAEQTLYTTIQLIADVLLLYRCFVLWGSNLWVIIVPSMTLLASVACGYYEAYVSNNASLAYLDNRFGIANASLVLATNILLTGAIAYRIWKTTREIESFVGRNGGEAKYQYLINIFVESGAVLAAAYIAFIVVYFHSVAASNIVGTMLPQLNGIAPTLIIIRLALGTAAGQKTTEGSDIPSDTMKPHTLVFAPGSSSNSSSTRDDINLGLSSHQEEEIKEVEQVPYPSTEDIHRTDLNNDSD